MKVVILAGGFGTRLGEYTHEIPKPMVPVGNIPIIIHIMSQYAKYGYKEFIVATGYKASVIESFFKERSNNFKIISDEQIDLDFVIKYRDVQHQWKVTLLFTGNNTMTGGRLKRSQKLIKDEIFFMTYGDGLSNIKIDKLLNHHKEQKKLATLSAVRPPVRFGEIEITGSQVTSFIEKPRLQKGWINGGFFVLNKKIFDFISGDEIMFEREPVESLVEINQLSAFKHNDFWQCMDTKRDKDLLEDLWNSTKTPW